MGIKSVKKIKLTKNTVDKIVDSYIEDLMSDKFSDFYKISSFYKNINEFRKERYLYLEKKDVYYDFNTGNIFPNPSKLMSYENNTFSDFKGIERNEKEKNEIRLKFPESDSKKVYVDCNVEKSGDGKSWDTAFKTISEAIQKTDEIIHILVTSGIYPEALKLESNIFIHGGYEKDEKYLWKAQNGLGTLVTGKIKIIEKNKVFLSNLNITISEKKYKGALFIKNSKEIEIYETKIKENHFNSCQNFEKALFIDSSTVDFYKSKIMNNSVSYSSASIIYGGAVYINSSTVRFIDSLFLKNKNNSYSTSYQYGGAIYTQNSDLDIINCKFLENFANYGKDIYRNNENVTIYGEKIVTYNEPKYVQYDNSISDDFTRPIFKVVDSTDENSDVFNNFIENDLINLSEDKISDSFLKNNFKLKSGFMIQRMVEKVQNEKIELNIEGLKISKDYIYNSFSSGENKIPNLYLESLYLNCDNNRAGITPYDKKILHDINRGHWDLWGNNSEGDIEIELQDEIFARNPEIDINHNGVVAIDFGTKSTVVVYQKDDEVSYIKRIGAGNLERDVANKDYENPTVLEFRNLEKFLKDYNMKVGRPETEWETLTTSYTAFNRLLDGSSEDYYSIFSDLKQWAGKGKKVKIKDKIGKSWDLPQFKDLDLEKDINPISIYAYYIGLAINNMHGDGIFMDYILSFPVKYEKELCEKICYSFERGLKKSLPTSILKSDVMEMFKVRIGASEPAAYAVCALQEYGFEPEEDENIVYGIFDFGGGTTDFDFGIWRVPKRGSYDYEIEHFYDNGDRYLGGENLLQLLAFEIFKMESNQKILKDKKITFILPPECKQYPGSEILINESQEAELNTRKLMEECRYFWENNGENFASSDDVSGKYNAGVLALTLYSSDGKNESCELNIDEKILKDVLVNRIDKGVRNFFESWREATNNIEEYEKFHIFLAGNSSKSKIVDESFKRHIEEIIEDSKKESEEFNFEGKFEIFPPLGTEASKLKQQERGGSLCQEIVPPTGKTGVAYGLIRSRESGNIKVIKRKTNQLKYFVGIEKRRKFKMIMNRNAQVNDWIELMPSDRKEFEIFYTDIPEATTNNLDIKGIKKIRCFIDEVNDENNIYIRAISHDVIEYTVASETEIKDANYSGKVYISKKLED